MGYRQCKYEKIDYSKLKSKKQKICETIDSRVRDINKKGFHYKKISNKSEIYYKQFEKTYEYKCAYCGINTSINATAMFEIDHFVNGKQGISPNGNTVDHIENLVFSCRKCNQAKDDFYVNNAYDLLHPDGGMLAKVFERDSHYMIVIKKEYNGNKIIEQFYKKMDFSDKFRKIDYLLLNLYYMRQYDKKPEIQNAISQVYIQLLEMRNRQI